MLCLVWSTVPALTAHADFPPAPAFLIGNGVPDSVRTHLVLVDVAHLGDDGAFHRGQVVCHRLVAQDVKALFDTLAKAKFPLRSVRPVSEFGFSDSLSMVADNSSAFNWRTVAGTRRLSAHARGLALDLNPWRNPFEHRRGTRPTGAVRRPSLPGTLSDTSLAVRFLRRRGWWWGGRWASGRDWQHFELAPAELARRTTESRTTRRARDGKPLGEAVRRDLSPGASPAASR